MSSNGMVNRAAQGSNQLTEQERFFYDNAGYAQRPDETEEQARERCAKELAAAETAGHAHGWRVSWEEEQEPDLSWMTAEEQAEEHEVLCAVLRDADGVVLASLGNIVDATSQYGRVVEAELCAEALDSSGLRGSFSRSVSIEQVLSALEQAISDVCDEDLQNEISDRYRELMGEARS